MSAASSMMIALQVSWRDVPAADRDAIYRFWTEYVRGVDGDHDEVWKRLGRTIMRSEPGEAQHLYWADSRDGPFHRRHRAVLTNLFEHQERFPNIDALHDALKLRCWHVEWKNGKPIPATTNFDECSEARMRRFNRRLEDWLRTPFAGRYFWPHLASRLRHEMVDQVLASPNETEAAADSAAQT